MNRLPGYGRILETLLLLLGSLSFACSDGGKQAVGCEDVPLYDIGADGGLSAAVKQAIDVAAAKGCITKTGHASSDKAAQ